MTAAIALAAACGVPKRVDVDLQIDLEVHDDSDPWDSLSGVRVCVVGADGNGLRVDFARDPGTYVLGGLPLGEPLDVTVQALDLDPDAVDSGDAPRVLAESRIEGAVLDRASPPRLSLPFAECDGPCPGPCAASGLPAGDGFLGLRRHAPAGG